MEEVLDLSFDRLLMMMIIDHIYAVKIHLYSKRTVYLSAFNALLNFAFSFLRMGKSEEIYGL